MATPSDFTAVTPASQQQLAYENEQLQRGDLIRQRALDRALALRTLQNRTIPDIINSQAGRGAFWTGATTRAVGRASEDVINTYGQGEADTQSSLADLLRNQFILGLGITL